jgi:hypothetical protein
MLAHSQTPQLKTQNPCPIDIFGHGFRGCNAVLIHNKNKLRRATVQHTILSERNHALLLLVP